jgi:predicted O-linked N-acetylglucosamine transferase (SPINDLY family)
MAQALAQAMQLHRQGRLIEAERLYSEILKAQPDQIDALNNRGAALSSLGREEEALANFREALRVKPDHVEAHYNCGSSLRNLGRYREALASFERALTLRPDYVEAHNNRGAVLEALYRLEPALAAYERALAIDPDFAEANANRIRVLCLLDRSDDALASLDRKLARRPNDAQYYFERGRLYLDLNRNDEAVSDFKKALALKPDFVEARFAECFAQLPILYVDEAEIDRRREAYAQKLRALCDDVAAGRVAGDLTKALAVKQPFLLAYQGRDDRALQQLYGALVRRIVHARYGDAPVLPPPPAPHEPVRIGIVSSFFYLHSNWKMPIKGWIGELDRRRFKVFGYYLGARRDAETERAASLCDRFVHRIMDVAGWRREILSDAPHVLIYPGLFMDADTFQLAAQRLAPVQCNSWGHPDTSGLPTLDYFLSSDLMEPPDGEDHYSEKLIRLPNLSIYCEPVDGAATALTRGELGLRPEATIFWCGQSLYKYLPQYDDVLARIAKQSRGCQFVFVHHSGAPPVNAVFDERLARAFAAHGLKASDHCVFLARMSQSRFIAAMGLADVFLDSIGWSGCNSTLESLAHNLPIVTLPGPLMRGRHSAAILQMLGIHETVAGSIDDYIAIAARLAADGEERRALSRRIADNKHRLYRDRACIAALEDFLDRAVRQRAR